MFYSSIKVFLIVKVPMPNRNETTVLILETFIQTDLRLPSLIVYVYINYKIYPKSHPERE